VSLMMNLHELIKMWAQVLCMLYLYQGQNHGIPFLFAVLSFGLVFWALYSFKLYQLTNMTKITTYVALPTLILISITTLINSFKPPSEPEPTSTSSFWTRHLETLMAVTFPLYAIFANLRSKRSSIKNPFLQRYEDFTRRNEAYHAYNTFSLFSSWCTNKFLYYFKYAMMALSIFTTTDDVSVLNLFLMVFSIICLSMESKVNTHWKRYLYLLDRLILFK
jgi:uncharacterized membrane protein YwzB